MINRQTRFSLKEDSRSNTEGSGASADTCFPFTIDLSHNNGVVSQAQNVGIITKQIYTPLVRSEQHRERKQVKTRYIYRPKSYSSYNTRLQLSIARTGNCVLHYIASVLLSPDESVGVHHWRSQATQHKHSTANDNHAIINAFLSTRFTRMQRANHVQSSWTGMQNHEPIHGTYNRTEKNAQKKL